MNVGDLVHIRNPPFDAGKQGLVVAIKTTPYGWSSLVLFANGEYYETNTMHCELAEVQNAKQPPNISNDRTHQERV